MSKGALTGAWAPSRANQMFLRAGQRGDLLRREELAGRAGDVAHDDEPRPRRDEAGDAVDVALRARDVRIEEADRDAVALHPVEERRVDGDVLVGRGDDLVALLERQAVDDDVDAFGRAADEAEVLLAARPAERAGQLLLDVLPGLLVVAGARGPLLGPGEPDERVEDRQRARAEAAEVQEGPLGVEDELVADELPVELLVAGGDGLGEKVGERSGRGRSGRGGDAQSGDPASQARGHLQEFFSLHGKSSSTTREDYSSRRRCCQRIKTGTRARRASPPADRRVMGVKRISADKPGRGISVPDRPGRGIPENRDRRSRPRSSGRRFRAAADR